tara:strand:+ start:1127 stop:1648 length:522 start_codon:yes stop_codon:yes gene_type:complete
MLHEHTENIIIVNNFLPEKTFHSFQKHFFDCFTEEDYSSKWYSLDQTHDRRDMCLHLLNFSSNYFDLSECIGYEVWYQHNSKPESKGPNGGWHFDKDEDHLDKTGEFLFPLCSIIYYVNVQYLTGGCLYVEDIKISPQNNRLVIIPPGKEHYVEPFGGKRTSMLVNPWNKVLE